MILYNDSTRFIARGTYHKRTIPKSAGFRWDKKAKIWWTKDIDVALQLYEYANAECRELLDRHESKSKASIEQSKANDADIRIPVPDELEYMPFQKAGIAYMHDRDNVLLADEMGLGKTIQAIGLINLNPDIRNILVICPASLKRNWFNELHKWLVDSYRIGIADSKTGFPAHEHIVIINYDILKKYEKWIRYAEWDLLIVDEAHYLKNPKAQRTVNVIGARSRYGKYSDEIPAKRKLYLTGTPIVNRPIELFPLISSLDNDTWTSFWKYARRYAGAEYNGYGWDFSGASNLEELQLKLRSTIMIRRRKIDVLTELPSKRRQVIELPANGCQLTIQAETNVWKRQEENLRVLRTRVELAKASVNPDDYKQAVEHLRDESLTSFSEIAKLRHDTAVAKIPIVLDHLKDALESGKVVVFAHHHDVMNAIKAAFQGCSAMITGKTPVSNRQAEVDRFQNDSNCTLFIGSITAAGVGITLTASSHIVFAELDWVPGNLTQAEDRLHRIGQEDSVLVQHLVLDGSLDARMAKILVDKQDVIDKAMDKPVEFDRKLITTPADDDYATSRFSKDDVAELADNLTFEQVELIHKALRIVSVACDGTYQKDERGFSRVDAGIGKSLAECSTLTFRQAALGLMVVKKYWRQLPVDVNRQLSVIS